MGKAFEGLGEWEYVMLAITMVGVVWLVMKQANIKLNVSQEGYLVQTAGNLGFDTVSTGTTHAGTVSGFSVGGMEPPTFHVAPYDPNELTGVNWNVMDDSDPDFVTLADARAKRDGLSNRAPAAGYRKKRNNVDGMLAGAMMGSSEKL